MEKIELKKYDSKFKNELNSWSEIEKSNGLTGFEDFVSSKGVGLGDYLDYFTNETDIETRLAFCNESLVGFISYTKELDSVHIEVAGVNPNERGKGFAKKIILKLKEELNKSIKVKIMFEIHKNNKSALQSYGKLAKISDKQTMENFIQMEM